MCHFSCLLGCKHNFLSLDMPKFHYKLSISLKNDLTAEIITVSSTIASVTAAKFGRNGPRGLRRGDSGLAPQHFFINEQ
jgi:hypothetical protein